MTQIGDIIGGRYRVIDQIGEGGMSRVWLVTDSLLRLQWAIRETDKNVRSETHAASIDVLRAEAKFMAKEFGHPALPHVVDIIEDNYSLFIVMEYIQGKDLLSIMKRGERPIVEDDVRDWGMQLCDVLSYLHVRGIVHRNVRPGNVMLRLNDQIKLFGHQLRHEFKHHLEHDVMPLGVREYAPPEAFIRDKQSTPRYDVYSLGVTLFHLATGKGPRDFADSPVLPAARSVSPTLSKGLEAIIAKATRFDPAERYQSCDEMRYDLEIVGEGGGNMLYASPPRSFFARIARVVKGV